MAIRPYELVAPAVRSSGEAGLAGTAGYAPSSRTSRANMWTQAG